MTTLRETAAQCCKKVYIGAAVLPKPLFVPDYDDEIIDGDDGKNTDDNDGAARRPKIKCGTVSTVEPEDDPSLSQAASERPLTRYAQVLTSEFNSIVIEHHLKWSPLVHTMPGPIHQSAPPTTHLGRYDFHHVDAMVDFAMQHDMHIKGHVLVWHVTSPPFLEDMSPEEVRRAVKRHIFTTMAYFKGRIKMWDVVNESLASDGTLVENIFYRKIGPNYIEKCFRWAHEADPEAFLIYNDNKVEGCGYGSSEGGNNNKNDEDDEAATESKRRCKAKAPNQAKADGFYNLLKDLVQKGVPIHGAGMQAHFNAGGVKHQRPPTPSMVKRQIRRIGKLGLKVNISEMDVRVSKLSSSEKQREMFSDATKMVRENAQTQIYQGILTAALSEPAFDGIWLWGYTDRHTWVKNFYYDDAPLIFSEDYERKQSYDGVEAALQTLCPGKKMPCVFLEFDYDEKGNEWGHEWMVPEPEDTEEGKNDTTKEGQPDWLQPT
mmetsp:Transcript_4247/g.7568  ORF Transcript_4247/g.7568 Transcript_4247/m.7568 type:complete len:489 (-) Transcript_4247:134-1600(-)